jgi:ribosomal protein S18 acetylase RimI-like enzyme
MDNSMDFRKYRPGDESDIASIHNSAFRNLIDSLPEVYHYRAISPGDVADWLGPKTNKLWIVESMNQIIAYAQVRVEIERGERNVPVLQFMPARSWDMNQTNIAALPTHQKKGVGSFLVESILKEYEDTAVFATALTYSDNAAGERLFQKQGFAVHDVFYYTPFSKEYPLANSSVYASLDLEALVPPNNLNEEVMFRRAVLRDAPAIVEIHQSNVWWCEECGTLDWNIRFIEGNFGHKVFVAEVNGEVIGEIDYLKDGRIGIGGVLSEFRNQGIGSAMFYRLLRAMQKAGFKSAITDSGLTQTEAIRMYEKFGFTFERRQNAWVKELT